MEDPLDIYGSAPRPDPLDAYRPLTGSNTVRREREIPRRAPVEALSGATVRTGAPDIPDAPPAPSELLARRGLERLGFTPGPSSDFLASFAPYTPMAGYDAGQVIGHGINERDPAAIGLGAGLSTLAIFGGPMARTANLPALRRAEQMTVSGAPREAIWNETGWFQGPDRRWRFEIDDSQMRHVIPPVQWLGGRAADGTPLMPHLERAYDIARQDLTPQAPVRVMRLFNHDELERAYPTGFTTNNERPGITGMPVQLLSDASGPEGIFAGPLPYGIIGLHRSLPPGTARSDALHELQHAVQEREGFSPGRGTTAPYWEAGPNGDPVWVSPLEAYRRASGEVEARNVQARMSMTPEERRARPPWTTEDVPLDRQIVNRPNGR